MNQIVVKRPKEIPTWTGKAGLILMEVKEVGSQPITLRLTTTSFVIDLTGKACMRQILI